MTIRVQKISAVCFAGAVLAVFPLAASARTLEDFIRGVRGTLISFVFPLLFVIATVIFVVSIIRYLYSAEADQAKIRATILWSVIALAAIISLWALVGFLTSYIGIGDIPELYGQPIRFTQ